MNLQWITCPRCGRKAAAMLVWRGQTICLACYNELCAK